MLKEKILKKLLQVFALVPQEQQNALAKELAKMIPADATAEVDWSVSWGYYLEKEEVNVGISLKIAPTKQSLEEIPMIDFLTYVVNAGQEGQMRELEKALDIAINDIVPNKKMTHTPTLLLTETIAVIHIRFWGAPSDEVKMNSEHEKKVLKLS